MKYHLLTLILFFFFLILFANNNVYAQLPLSGKLIIVDPGHGGADPGTVSGEVFEKDINLKISLELEKSLNKLGASVILIRTDDYDLSSPGAYWRKKSDFDNRINLINKSAADLYLSIHLNYLNDSSYYGPQVFYDKDNVKLATVVQSHLNKELNGDREIKKIPSNTYMYSKINVNGLLIECGFLSNDVEKRKLLTDDYQKLVANSIANSLKFYFS